MLLPDSTYKSQSGFAQYCRNGNPKPIPGVIPDRMEQYRKLVLNVVVDMLENAYPLTSSFLKNLTWETLCSEFLAEHACQSPQIWKMPGEIIPWIVKNKQELLKRYPFLHNLLFFEWTETELFLMEDQATGTSQTGDVLFCPLILNPEHRLLHFDYPVHLKKPSEISNQDLGQYLLLANRNQDGEVLFTELSPALYYALALLQETPLTIRQICRAIETDTGFQLSAKDYEVIIEFFQTAHKQLLVTCLKSNNE